MDIQTLEQRLKTLIIDALALEDVSEADISSSEPLFDGGLELDSIDALEVGVAVQKTYGVKLDANSDDVKQAFYSVATLAQKILSERGGANV
ncbi:phosphopantetheine-binding protein [Ruegeria sp. MALMAid1280]|uniref:phosphopantetheine-binding protein n=1 Tax=Ruegeria sp. MALMAid1280 TaxID=3411634 RepID=UPI003BA08692